MFTRVRNWTQDKLNAINPQAALFDQEDDNFAAGLNNCVTKDGLNKPSAAMDWNSQNLSNVGVLTATTVTIGSGNAITGSTGSFTGTLTGYASGPTGTVSYTIANGVVTLYLAAGISGTSNSSAMTMTGLPVAVRPSSARGFCCTDVSDNGNSNMQAGGVVGTGGTITFNLWVTNAVTNRVTRDPAAFTGSGTKGLISQWQISYPL